MIDLGSHRQSFGALFVRFLRFGFFAWGGPVAQIEMIRREVVEEQQWVDPARFNRLLAVYQVLPGPEAHELCVHLGMMQRGRLGGLLAGLGFMLPGLLFMLVLSWLYGQFDLDNPLLAAMLLGLQIGVIALIVRAVHRIAAHILEDKWLWATTLGVGAAALAGVAFWITLPAAGLAYSLVASGRRLIAAGVVVLAMALAIITGDLSTVAQASPAASAMAAGSASALALFFSGLKAGLLTFGGAYTAIPFLRDDAAARGWVDDTTFLDGLAFSQMIPAPLIIFATFVGYQAGGLVGALTITAGIFLPAFSFTLIFFNRLESIVDDARLQRFLAGVAAGVVGLIAATTLQLGAGVADAVPYYIPALLIFGVAIVILYRLKSKLAVPAVLLLAAAAGAAGF